MGIKFTLRKVQDINAHEQELNFYNNYYFTVGHWKIKTEKQRDKKNDLNNHTVRYKSILNCQNLYCSWQNAPCCKQSDMNDYEVKQIKPVWEKQNQELLTIR